MGRWYLGDWPRSCCTIEQQDFFISKADERECKFSLAQVGKWSKPHAFKNGMTIIHNLKKSADIKFSVYDELYHRRWKVYWREVWFWVYSQTSNGAGPMGHALFLYFCDQLFIEHTMACVSLNQRNMRLFFSRGGLERVWAFGANQERVDCDSPDSIYFYQPFYIVLGDRFLHICFCASVNRGAENIFAGRRPQIENHSVPSERIRPCLKIENVPGGEGFFR